MFLLLPLLLLMHLILLVNTRFTLWPEMVTYPYLLNNGFLLYKDIINPYPPFFTSFLTIFARIFDYHPLPYQILAWSLILTIDVTIYFVAKKIFGNNLRTKVSTAFFVFFSIPFGANSLWYDLVQTPFILLSLLYLYRFLSKPYLRFAFYSFFFLTIAFFVKQQIAWLVIWFLIVLLFKLGKGIKKLLGGTIYIILPFLLLLIFQLIVFWQKGTAPDFIFWTLYFPFFQASKLPGYILLPTLRQLLIVLSLVFFFLPIFVQRKQVTNLIVATGIILLLFAYPRFDYFHLVPMLSVLSLTVGSNIHSLKSFKNIRQLMTYQSLIIIASLLSFLILLVFSIRYFVNNWHQEVRFFERDIYQAASTLGSVTEENEIIYIQNGPDQLLPLAKILPPKPWADEFPWYLEVTGVQERIVTGLQTQNPHYIIFKPYDQGDNFYRTGVYRPQKIAEYLDIHYQNFIKITDTLWLKIKKEEKLLDE